MTTTIKLEPTQAGVPGTQMELFDRSKPVELFNSLKQQIGIGYLNELTNTLLFHNSPYVLNQKNSDSSEERRQDPPKINGYDTYANWKFLIEESKFVYIKNEKK